MSIHNLNSEKKINIGLIGSCVSRDNFNVKFNPDWKKYFDCTAVHYQMSLVSLMSDPVDYECDDFFPLAGHDLLCTQRDFSKMFLVELLNKPPDILIIDFFSDSRFSCAEVNGSYVTYNEWKLSKAVKFKNIGGDKKIGMFVDEQIFIEVFSLAVEKFKTFIKVNIPRTKIILNSARGVYQYTENGVKYYFPKKFVDAINYNWEKLDSIFIEKLTPDVIRFTGFELEGNPKHPWGIGCVHYEYKFYKDFMKSLLRQINI